jgi:hypothetical protein
MPHMRVTAHTSELARVRDAASARSLLATAQLTVYDPSPALRAGAYGLGKRAIPSRIEHRRATYEERGLRGPRQVVRGSGMSDATRGRQDGHGEERVSSDSMAGSAAERGHRNFPTSVQCPDRAGE